MELDSRLRGNDKELDSRGFVSSPLSRGSILSFPFHKKILPFFKGEEQSYLQSKKSTDHFNQRATTPFRYKMLALFEKLLGVGVLKLLLDVL